MLTVIVRETVVLPGVQLSRVIVAVGSSVSYVGLKLLQGISPLSTTDVSGAQVVIFTLPRLVRSTVE